MTMLLAQAAPTQLLSIRRSADRWRQIHDCLRTLAACAQANAYLDVGRRGVWLDEAVDVDRQLQVLSDQLDREGTALTVELLQHYIKTVAPHPGQLVECTTPMEYARTRDAAMGLPTDVVPVPEATPYSVMALPALQAEWDRCYQPARTHGKYSQVPTLLLEALIAEAGSKAKAAHAVQLRIDLFYGLCQARGV